MTYEEFKFINQQLHEVGVNIASNFFFNLSDKEKGNIPTIEVTAEQMLFVSSNSTVFCVSENEDGSILQAYDYFGAICFLKIIEKTKAV